MSQKTPVIIMGLGVIGRTIAKAALLAPDLEVVAAVDPAHAGERLGELLEDNSTMEVGADIAAVARLAKGGAVLQATGSYLHQVESQLEACMRARLNIVSTCEELAYPWLASPDRANVLDQLACDYGVRIVGTGVNPGFVFERLSSIMSLVGGEVKRVHGVRVVDTRTRRHALQMKTGAGLTKEAFVGRVNNGGFGHVGLKESAALLALGCGMGKVDRVSESVEPVISDRELEAAVLVQKGQVAGIHQIARAYKNGAEVVTLDLTIAIGAENPRDEIRLDTDPPLELIVKGGTPGDTATAWASVHAVRQLIALSPGLKTVLDLPAGRARSIA